VRMSEDKVRTKDSCWSVGTIYDPRELPGVSTAGPGIGRGVTLRVSLIQSNCTQQWPVAIYSASAVERATEFCFFEAQDTRDLPKN
jgi:hypothetical protein